MTFFKKFKTFEAVSLLSECDSLTFVINALILEQISIIALRKSLKLTPRVNLTKK